MAGLSTGPYAVGTASLEIEAVLTAAPCSSAAADKPAPIVQLWYPSDANPRASGLQRAWARLRRRAAGAGEDSGRVDVPMSEASSRYPVVLYFPGWSGTRIENYGLICELATHGFVVAGVTYPAMLPGMTPAAYAQQVEELEHWILYTVNVPPGTG